MTNGEKFKETFGFKPDGCPMPPKVCKANGSCQECVFNEWWDKDYLECFTLKEEFEDVS